MMGLKVGEGLLYVKRMTTIATNYSGASGIPGSGLNPLEGEMFKALLDDKPT